LNFAALASIAGRNYAAEMGLNDLVFAAGA